MDEGERPVGDGGEAASTWQALLDAQVRLEEQRTSLRTSVIGIFLAIVLGAIIIRRFVFFLTTPESWLLVASPAAAMAAAGLLDHYVLGERIRRLAELAAEIESSGNASLQEVRREAVDPPKDGLAVLAFYGLPALLALGLAGWGLL